MAPGFLLLAVLDTRLLFMYRLFAALPVPAFISGELSAHQKNLSGASWRPELNFHITLRFFGDISQQAAEDLDHALAEIPARQFQIELDGAGWFGRKEPRAVWARVKDNEALITLAGQCERAARRLGLPAEKRAYRPHITLAYTHGTLLFEAQRWVEANQSIQAGPFWADRFYLYSSQLGGGPSRYRVEAEYPLN